jgi:hypothetical protein
MKTILKNSTIVLVLLFVTNSVLGQVYPLKTKVAETDLKIICDSAYFFMDRKDVTAILKKMEKVNKVKYTMPIKKMNGVCFEAINLRKPNEDKDIEQVQQLFLTTILNQAITTKKVAVQWKKSKEFIPELIKSTTNNTNTVFSDKNKIVLQINSIAK